jgi:hypothetical protein
VRLVTSERRAKYCDVDPLLLEQFLRGVGDGLRRAALGEHPRGAGPGNERLRCGVLQLPIFADELIELGDVGLRAVDQLGLIIIAGGDPIDLLGIVGLRIGKGLGASRESGGVGVGCFGCSDTGLGPVRGGDGVGGRGGDHLAGKLQPLALGGERRLLRRRRGGRDLRVELGELQLPLPCGDEGLDRVLQGAVIFERRLALLGRHALQRIGEGLRDLGTPLLQTLELIIPGVALDLRRGGLRQRIGLAVTNMPRQASFPFTAWISPPATCAKVRLRIRSRRPRYERF